MHDNGANLYVAHCCIIRLFAAGMSAEAQLHATSLSCPNASMHSRSRPEYPPQLNISYTISMLQQARGTSVATRFARQI